jgi:hypothetical protein
MVFKQFYQTKEGFFVECITKNKNKASFVKEADNG